MDTGVPYTTLSELYHGKTDINKCSVQTAARLSAYFECPITDLLNPISYLAGRKGNYRKITYEWKEKGSMSELHLYDKEKDILFDKEDSHIPRTNAMFQALTEALIDTYLSEREVERMLDEAVTALHQKDKNK